MNNLLKYSLVSFFTLLVLWAAGFLYFSAHALSIQPQNIEKTTDAVIVLTGGKQRIETGLELFANGRTRHLFITGVHPEVSRKEILDMWAGETSLPPCCITLGYKARTTIQNAQETKDWMEDYNYSSIRLVTSNYHMPRALLELRHTLPDVEFISHPVNQPDINASTQYFWHLLFTEYHKTLFRRISLTLMPSKSSDDENNP